MIHSKTADGESEVVINNCEFERISWKTIFIPIAVILVVSITIMIVFWRFVCIIIGVSIWFNCALLMFGRMQSRVLQSNKNYNIKNIKESPSSMERLHQPEQVNRQHSDDAMHY